MAETLRDVTIKVNVANGNMSLGALDISEFLKSTQVAAAAVDSLEKRLEKLNVPYVTASSTGAEGSPVSSASSRGFGSSSGSGASSAGVDDLAGSFQVLVAQAKGLADVFADLILGGHSKTGSGVKSRVVGGGSLGPLPSDVHGDLDARFAEEGMDRPTKERDHEINTLTPEERAMTHSAGKIQKEREAAKEKSRKEDEDRQNEHKSAKKNVKSIQSQMNSEGGHAASSAMELAKGIAFVVTATDQEAESFARVVVAMQGYYNMANGAIGIYQSLGVLKEAQIALTEAESTVAATATGATTTEAAAVGTLATAEATAGGAAGVMAAGGATAAAATGAIGVSAAAATPPVTGLAVAVNLLFAPMTLIAAGIATVIGALALWRLASQEARERLTADYDQIIAKSEGASSAIARTLSTKNSQSSRLAEFENEKGRQRDTERILPDIQRQRGVDAQSREIDNRDDLNPEQKSERKQRLQQDADFTKQQNASEDRLKTLHERKAVLDKKAVDQKGNKSKIIASHSATQRKMMDRQRQLEENPTGRINDFQAGADGRWSMSAEQQKQHANIPLAMAADQSQQASELSNNAKEAEETAKQRLATEREIVQTLAQQNTSIREYQKNAHEANQASKEREKSHQISTGSLDFGTLNRKKSIQDKHDRIVAQQKANVAAGRDKNFNVEQYTQEENVLIGKNDAAASTRDAQVQATYAQYGFRSRDEDQGDNKAAAERQQQADEMAAMQNPGADEKIQKGTEESGKLVSELGDKMKESFKLEDLVNAMKAKFDEVKAEVARQERAISQWTSGS